MSNLFEKSFWVGVFGVFRPEIILLLTRIFIPFSIILIIVIIFVTYLFTKRFIIKKSFNLKNHLLVIITSLVIYYLLVGSFMLFMEIGLAGLTQYI